MNLNGGVMLPKISDELLDPVSFELMTDAVLLVPCGHTFKETTINGLGKKICPLDRIPILNTITNYTVRKLVAETQEVSPPKKEPQLPPIEVIKRAEGPPAEAIALFERGKFLYAQKKYQEAVGILLNALTLYPTYEDAYALLVTCLDEQKDPISIVKKMSHADSDISKVAHELLGIQRNARNGVENHLPAPGAIAKYEEGRGLFVQKRYQSAMHTLIYALSLCPIYERAHALFENCLEEEKKSSKDFDPINYNAYKMVADAFKRQMHLVLVPLNEFQRFSNNELINPDANYPTAIRHLERAREFSNQKNYEQAISQAVSALNFYPGYLKAYLLISEYVERHSLQSMIVLDPLIPKTIQETLNTLQLNQEVQSPINLQPSYHESVLNMTLEKVIESFSKPFSFEQYVKIKKLFLMLLQKDKEDKSKIWNEFIQEIWEPESEEVVKLKLSPHNYQCAKSIFILLLLKHFVQEQENYILSLENRLRDLKGASLRRKLKHEIDVEKTNLEILLKFLNENDVSLLSLLRNVSQWTVPEIPGKGKVCEQLREFCNKYIKRTYGEIEPKISRYRSSTKH